MANKIKAKQLDIIGISSTLEEKYPILTKDITESPILKVNSLDERDQLDTSNLRDGQLVLVSTDNEDIYFSWNTHTDPPNWTRVNLTQSQIEEIEISQVKGLTEKISWDKL